MVRCPVQVVSHHSSLNLIERLFIDVGPDLVQEPLIRKRWLYRQVSSTDRSTNYIVSPHPCSPVSLNPLVRSTVALWGILFVRNDHGPPIRRQSTE